VVNKKQKAPHGGARTGSGRPLLADGTGKRVNVYLDQRSIDIALEAGSDNTPNGTSNMSKGIRHALEFWAEYGPGRLQPPR
jgi:hypothetical protein